MKKRLMALVIVITSLSLVGIILTQVYWVRESYGLNEELFSNSVRIAIKGVANQMLNVGVHQLDKEEAVDAHGQKRLVPEVKRIDPGLLDFKLTEELRCMQVGNDYEYALIDLKDSSFLYGNSSIYRAQLLKSPHQIPMTGFKDPQRYTLAVFFPRQRALIIYQMVKWILISGSFSIVLILSFYFTLFYYFRQKKLSEMKSDFINNMTHEFKTPLATISLASEMLMNKQVIEDPARSGRYARIIFDENTRLQHQVEHVLNISILERGDFNLKIKEVDVHELIKNQVDSFNLTVKEKGGEILTRLYAKRHVVQGDRMHLTNVITNLLDNANKYSEGTPHIIVSTHDSGDGVVISVEDKGIGISLEEQKNVFKKLYRISTGDVHNVKGFGIGLYYVARIVEAHSGKINLHSEPSKGSRFDVYLPWRLKSSANHDDHFKEAENSSG